MRVRRCYGSPQNSWPLPLDRGDIAAALIVKGFYLDPKKSRDHDVYRLDANPTEPVLTKLSRGGKYRTLGPDLVSKIRRQLKLSNKKQLEDFVECPMTKELYIEHLHETGVLPR